MMVSGFIAIALFVAAALAYQAAQATRLRAQRQVVPARRASHFAPRTGTRP